MAEKDKIRKSIQKIEKELDDIKKTMGLEEELPIDDEIELAKLNYSSIDSGENGLLSLFTLGVALFSFAIASFPYMSDEGKTLVFNSTTIGFYAIVVIAILWFIFQKYRKNQTKKELETLMKQRNSASKAK